MKIIPAILTDSPAELERMIRQAESFTDWVQVDVMDGRFVPSTSIKAPDLAAVKTGVKLEAHLMVENPETHFQDFGRAGAKKVIFHCEATPSPQKAIALARDLGLEVGVALNPETPLSAISPLVGLVDSVLFLSVDPGFYGSPFLPQVLDKIKTLREAEPEARIGIDGGIKGDNIALVASYGVDYICVGSAIFKEADPGASFLHLQRKLGLRP